MDKNFSNEQIHIVKMLMDLQLDLDNRINENIQETFLRKQLDDDAMITILESIQDSLKYVLDDKISSLIRYLKS